MVKLFYEQKDLNATDFSLLNDIPDSTFFGWLKEYNKLKDNWLNVASDISKSDIPVKEKYQIVAPGSNIDTTFVNNPPVLPEGFIEIEYKGVIIRAESKYLKAIMGFIHKW